jgi:hypothetical protein
MGCTAVDRGNTVVVFCCCLCSAAVIIGTLGAGLYAPGIVCYVVCRFSKLLKEEEENYRKTNCTVQSSEVHLQYVFKT